MAAILAAITVICGLLTTLGKAPEEPDISIDSDESSPWFKPALSAAVLLILATAFRTVLYPLGGFDTFTRWDALAREMLKYSSLSFYPPITGADFSIYVLPDGFPPLVASVYWWIYAATGTALPQLTAISVTLQLASIVGLTWAAAETAFGKKAASFSLLALAASPLLIRSVEIGQESGFLALAVAGQICFTHVAIRRPSLAPVYAAALFAALGALARDYGAAFALPGFFILFSNPATRSHALRYALLAAVVAAPWYVRNWAIAESPLYPFTLPGAPHSNQLLSELLSYYGGIFGIAAFGLKEWLGLGYEIIAGGSIALLAALPYLARNARKSSPCILSLAVIAFLWLWSVGKTSGGVIYSLRVLAPAIVILALIAGKTLAELPDRGLMKRASWLLIPAALWGLLSALSFPLQPWQISEAFLTEKGAAPEFNTANEEFAALINRLEIPSTGILTDSPFLAVTMKRETRFRPVMIWSSEVSSILSRKDSSGETAKLLLGKDISLVVLNRSSIHNDFLFKIPFYRDGVNRWQEAATHGDWVLFAITSVNVR